MHARLIFRLDLELCTRGTWSSEYRQWHPGPPERGCEPAGGTSILSHATFSKFCTMIFRSGGASRQMRGGPRSAWDVAMFGVPGGIVTRCSSPWGVTTQWKLRARGNHDHDFKPMGRRAAEVMGVEAIVTTIPEPTKRHTYGMCGTFHFCVVVSPLC
jgi:hypothetical protein